MTIDMETLQQKKRRLYGKKYLSKHIAELNALTNVKIEEGDLLSIADTDLVSLSIKEHFQPSQKKFYEATIPVLDKERFLLYIGGLIEQKDGKAYVSVEHSLDCGLVEIKSLEDFNVNFDWKEIPSELFSITLNDFSNRLLIDICIEEGECYLEIEAHGDEWATVEIVSES